MTIANLCVAHICLKTSLSICGLGRNVEELGGKYDAFPVSTAVVEVLEGNFVEQMSALVEEIWPEKTVIL